MGQCYPYQISNVYSSKVFATYNIGTMHVDVVGILIQKMLIQLSASRKQTNKPCNLNTYKL